MTKTDKQQIHDELAKSYNHMVLVLNLIETVFGKKHRFAKRARDFLAHLEHFGHDVGD